MGLPVIYVFTHDSIFVGEDGPTHQPVEQVASLRAIPNLTVIRPADAREVAGAWAATLENRQGPVALVLSRQKLPILTGADPVAVGRGAYVVADSPNPQLILIATGSEVSLVVEAQNLLTAQGIQARVVSMPSWELFEQQPQSYRDEVLPPSITRRLAVEAGVALGWSRYVGPEGDVVAQTTFGASAPYKVLAEKFGFTPEAVVERARALLA
jgi:transketolase